MSALATSLLVASLLSQTDSGAPPASTPPPPPPPPPMESVSPAPVAPVAPAAPGQPVTTVVSDTSFGVHIGVNLGLLAVDLQVKHFYLYLAGNLGIPLVTNGTVGATVLGVGYTTALSQPGESMWFMDFFFHALPGWQQVYNNNCFDFCAPSNQPFVGLGVGVGFRFLHRSGFTMGFKIPVFGAAVGPGTSTNYTYSGSQSVATYYLANLITLPIVSFGFRF